MDGPFTNEVAGQLRAEMARRNVSRVELATRLHVSRTYVDKRYTGEVSCSVADLDLIAEALDMPVLELIPHRDSLAEAS